MRTYDHTILSNTVVAPLDADAAVVRIKGTRKAISIKTDCNPRYVYLNPYLGGMHAVAEAARNVACTGALPLALTNCLNFGSPEKPAGYFQLREAIRGMAAAASALGTPVVSGNVSLFNESENGAILPTPTVGMVGLIEDVDLHVGSAARPGDLLLLLGARESWVGGSEYLALAQGANLGPPPPLDLGEEVRLQSLVLDLISRGLIHAAHDTSEGGLLVAICEMLIPTSSGADLNVDELLAANEGRVDRTLFGEAGSRILVSVSGANAGTVQELATETGVGLTHLGTVGNANVSVDGLIDLPVESIRSAWLNGLR